MNFHKSSLQVSSNVPVNFAARLAGYFGVPITKTLEKYLGIPILKRRANNTFSEDVSFTTVPGTSSFDTTTNP